jgi:hypothetical protein
MSMFIPIRGNGFTVSLVSIELDALTGKKFEQSN